MTVENDTLSNGSQNSKAKRTLIQSAEDQNWECLTGGAKRDTTESGLKAFDRDSFGAGGLYDFPDDDDDDDDEFSFKRHISENITDGYRDYLGTDEDAVDAASSIHIRATSKNFHICYDKDTTVIVNQNASFTLPPLGLHTTLKTGMKPNAPNTKP
ncbi:glycosyl hydrolase family 18 [Colletotrichum tofieldiae]|nr:glycosyl hydrolase family 18 [Colletotrichum tofieldiae]GKT80770.1 glycosyl hydrolase family 18 [Colletotrichum tofieldiae]